MPLFFYRLCASHLSYQINIFEPFSSTSDLFWEMGSPPLQQESAIIGVLMRPSIWLSPVFSSAEPGIIAETPSFIL